MLARGLRDGERAIAAELDAATAALEDRHAAPGVRDGAVRDRVAGLDAAAFSRSDYDTRRAAQDAALGLPALPTTTIGSFPQTGAIRRERGAIREGRDRPRPSTRASSSRRSATSSSCRSASASTCIVHGEPERNDMVQYFAENLDGFAVTQNGWVQSYGSRATPPQHPVG